MRDSVRHWCEVWCGLTRQLNLRSEATTARHRALYRQQRANIGQLTGISAISSFLDSFVFVTTSTPWDCKMSTHLGSTSSLMRTRLSEMTMVCFERTTRVTATHSWANERNVGLAGAPPTLFVTTPRRDIHCCPRKGTLMHFIFPYISAYTESLGR